MADKGLRGVFRGAGWSACLLAGLGFLALAAPVQAVTGGLDLRVLVDVSGSMKQTDPGNLRQPAVRLLVGLLPAGMRAGVWMFGERVEPLQPVAEVTSAWRTEARRRAAQIHSRGQLTDIGQALLAASADWPEGEDGHRAILLLTDGMVDVGKDEALNRAARARVLEEILPRLKARGVTLYTVALSAAADHELLKSLAAGSDGWYELAHDADELQRIFLHMFEKSAHPDALPLVENRFMVDGSIEEMNVLVFHAPGQADTELETPSGERISRQQPSPGGNWAHEEGFDLITLRHPAPGQWRVVGGQDPDNRVLVVTNLQLQSKPLPNHLLAGEPLEYGARVVQAGEVAASEQFLKVLTLTLTHYPERGEPQTWVLQGDGRSPEVTLAGGIYRLGLAQGLSPGRHEFELVLDGKSFQRQKSQSVMVSADAVALEALPTGEDGQPGLRLKVDATLLDPDSVRATVSFSGGAGEARPLSLARNGTQEWEGHATGLAAGGYQASAQVQAVTRQGREVTLRTRPLALTVVPAPAPPPPARGVSWPVVAAVLVLLNIVGGGGAWYLRRRWRSTHAKRVHQVVAGLES